jgi:hypothetical protein
MPAIEVRSQLLIEHSGPDLHQPMCAVRRPPHLLLLDEPLADHLVDRGLDEPGGNWLAVSVTIGVVRDRLQVRGNVVHELFELLLKFFGAIGLGADIPGQAFERRQRAVWAAMPEVCFRAA